jgi:hypothetical protein
MLTITTQSENDRLREAREKSVPWKKWGPYLSERQWGTVREDYSSDGNAWDYFPHDQARSRAYHWGEDGLAGISDEKQRLCFAIALWNGADPILKERLFGLTNSEGNHGEDVKEYYFYLDSSPTHSYMRYLYKYPQRPFPYLDLVTINRKRSRKEPEYELMDTGIFDDNRYFDVFVEYAKNGPEDILIEITAWNRGPAPASLDVLPTLWFRNTWNWWPAAPQPSLKQVNLEGGSAAVLAQHTNLGNIHLFTDSIVPFLFTENETNTERLWGKQNVSSFVKDGINDYIVNGRTDAVNPQSTGTKCSAHYRLSIEPGKSQAIRLRLTDDAAFAAAKSSERTQFFQARYPQERM